jgi:chromosomal replication initiator protein
MPAVICGEIWAEIADGLAERIGKDRYAHWLHPMSVLLATEDELRLGVPNAFWLDWVERHYLGEVAAAVEQRLHRAVRVTLAIDPELFRSLRKSQDRILAGVDRVRAEEAVQLELAGWKPGPAVPAEPAAPARPQDEVAGARPPAGAARPFPAVAHGPNAGPSAGTVPAAPRAPEEAKGEVQTLKNFVVGPSNRMAFASALQVVESPGQVFNPLFIYGSCGIGKTHLMKGIWAGLRARHPDRQVRFLTGEDFLNQFVMSTRTGTTVKFRERHRAPQVLVIDDIHILRAKKKTQEEFLFTFNTLVDAGHQVVLSSDSHPKTIADLPESLTGRFLAGLVVNVARPEFEVRLEILRRRAVRARIPLREDVLVVIAEKVRSNIRELIGAFTYLEQRSFQDGRPLDPATALVLLAEELKIEERKLGLPVIVQCVGRHYGIPVEEILSPSRHRSLTLARQVAMYIARKHTKRSLAEIGTFFGGRNHTSVKTAESKVEALRLEDPALARDIEKIIDSFEG